MKYKYAIPPRQLMITPLPRVEWRDLEGLRTIMHTLLNRTGADTRAHDYVNVATVTQLRADLKANGFVFPFRQRLERAGIWNIMTDWKELVDVS